MLENIVQFFDEFTKSGRVQDLKQLAREQKFGFKKRSAFGSQITDIKGFKVFSGKGNKRFVGILSQSSDAFKGEIRFYDFLVTKDLETKTTSVVEIFCEELFADYLMIEPKGTFSKMKGFFMSEEREFPSLDAFYNNFQITSKVPDASLILQASALDLMTQHPNIYCEMEGNHFIFYFRKKQMEIQNIVSTINFAEEFVRLLCFDRQREFV